ncbi:MAG TPA: acyl-CoA dehydrogenase [Aeromicrobium sp.]|nr:acyl-CoA dehydrogenase [Aeromicrobium sp.]HKY57375.1 acyl-CoA dehydrogenase [Aeromicrobium sp.]
MDALADEISGVLADVLDKGTRAGTWAAAADAGLTAAVAPAEFGGEGLGVDALAVMLRELGRRAHDLPVWETLVCGLMTTVQAGGPDVQQSIVPRIVSGDLHVAPALSEVGAAMPATPATVLADGAVTGTKIHVPVFESALLLVSVAVPGEVAGRAAFVDPKGPGVEKIDETGSADRAVASYRFTGAPAVAILAEGSGEVLRRHAVAGQILWADGLLSGAMELTADYIRTREQFGRKLAEFQAVAQQIADVYVDARAVSLVAGEVARRLSAGQPLDDDLAIASYVVCDRAVSAVQTCHHLHGGTGVDITYPLTRYFSRLVDVTHLLGGADRTLAQVPAVESPDGKGAELTESQQAFRREIRDYFAGLTSRDDRVEMLTDRHGPAYHRIIKQMGSDKMMGVGWPTEYGGRGLGGIEQQIFANEAARADVHLPAVTLQTVGPTLQAFGTQEQKDKFLADILSGDVHFAIGYSEADAGTDLASLRCSARRDGDDYVVNGQKMWTTGGHAADYIWLAVRTDPDAPKHKGISVLIVDTKDPGYSWTPIVTCDGSHHVNATSYDNIRVPASMLVGEENEGWRLITTQLNHERVMLGPAGRLEGLRDLVAEWAAERDLMDAPDVRNALARVTAVFRVNELLNWQVAAGGASGTAAIADASASKVLASEEVQELGMALLDVVAAHGDPTDPETAYLLNYLDLTAKRNLVLTFGGGVNEIQRELIAQFGLGLPRVPR